MGKGGKGGAKNGKCEVNKELDCGWEKIYRRLEKLGKTENIKKIIKIRDYSKMECHILKLLIIY
jgi:electron transport complex protein RnfC